MNINLAIRKYFKTIFWSLIMGYLLFSPSSAIPKTHLLDFPQSDKIIHAAMFAILTYLYLSESSIKEKLAKTGILLFFVGIILVGITSEVIQHFFIPGRTGNVYDLLADLFGFFLGLSTFLIVKRIFRRKLTIV